MRSSSLSESQLSSLLCLALTNQPPTILGRHRCRITPTLSLSKRVVGMRSIFSRTRSVSLPTSNGFTMISSASRRIPDGLFALLGRMPKSSFSDQT